jgi:hypothetical protein
MKPENIFKIFTSAIEAHSDSGRHILRGIATGTALDAEGDRMSEGALRSMESQIVGLTLHKDHVFKVDNTLGHFTSAKIASDKSNNLRELWVEAELEPFDINPDARMVYEKIQSGTRLGFSVAGLLRGWEKLESSNGNERFLITDIELLSIDLVTIPAYRGSQGTVTAIEGSSALAYSVSGESFICKEIGSLIRNSEPESAVEQSATVEKSAPRLSILPDSKVEKSEPHASASPDPDVHISTLMARIKSLEEKISHIESSIVSPPKSAGIMLDRSGKPHIDSSEMEAFEKGAVKLL